MDYEKLGLKLICEFITEEEESNIINNLNTFPKNTSQKGRNSIQRFGSDLPYRGNMISKEIPEYLKILCQKLFDSKLVEELPDSITINEYREGQGINPHIDSQTSGKTITVLSLMSDATMRFERQKEKRQFSILVPRRCLTQMTGEIRNNWTHSIDPVLSDRYSVVFRKGTNRNKSK